MFKKLLSLVLPGMLFFPLGKNINEKEGAINCSSFYDYLKEFGATINGKKGIIILRV